MTSNNSSKSATTVSKRPIDTEAGDDANRKLPKLEKSELTEVGEIDYSDTGNSENIPVDNNNNNNSSERDSEHIHVDENEIEPIRIIKNLKTNKYIFPEITKEDSLKARMFLKQFGLRNFLDSYLPEELNSLYVYYIIKLLGFEITDQVLMSVIYEFVDSETIINDKNKIDKDNKDYSFSNFDDPLDKKFVVRLIKDLQKAINKILCTRIKLSNFSTIDDFANKLKTAKKILVLTGAGVSTSLGIPDFRSSEGFYSKIKFLGLDDPQDVFNYDIFVQNPSVFYNIAHMVLPPENIYSPLHSFIKMLQDQGKLLRNYTQNIDNLESYAGINPDKLVQCHGSFATASCITCHWQLQGEKIFKNIRNVEIPLCPYCYNKRKEIYPTVEGDEEEVNSNKKNQDNNERSKSPINDNNEYFSNIPKSFGVLKPDITFFGEALPSKFHKLIKEDVSKCDLLICIGTSLKVAPVSEIVNMVPANIPQVLINKDPVKHCEFDLTLLGLCDDVVGYITKKCNWKIPHKDWDILKNTKFDCKEDKRGVYEIEPSNNNKK